ncbi:uncharacterized protein LOC8288831 [Ricinus communis]|uniref:Homer protein n=1 Tax=Ricinus communis TaxID=3988 RepID=B9RYS9_RICCO|nr:uncharacterized protein LOC8288831 [Ricinus communis]EEF43431.1 conserved hypothetical protein [Ricinus communis]|eukprot:XP_002518898.1 uncharacterized protein LOC8288831 [Ricinus communis]
MVTINNTSSLAYPNPKSLFKKPFCITSPTCSRLFYRVTTSLPKPLLVQCSKNDDSQESNSLKDALSGMVDKQVEALFSREENRVLIDGLEKASQRLERAKRDLAEIERQELEAEQMRVYINQLESRASEIAECQQEIIEARAKVEEAERSLSLNKDPEDGLGGETINKDEERWESIKAASISAFVGTLAGLPISLTQVTSIPQLILPSATTFISCALFGVTFRYAVRRDLDNFQLKTGTSAAFGFVKGLGTLAGGPPFELNPASFLSHALNGAVYVSENLLIFAFAAVSLDFCIKMRLLSPFPMKKPN